MVMNFAELRYFLFEAKAKACSACELVEDVCPMSFKGIAMSESLFKAIEPSLINYIVLFNLPSINTASRVKQIDGINIFLVKEENILYPVFELNNLTSYPNDQRGKMV